MILKFRSRIDILFYCDFVKWYVVEETKNEAVSTVVDVTNSKTDTNYSKSRIKISPYRRSSRISEQYSTIANYSGNLEFFFLALKLHIYIFVI